MNGKNWKNWILMSLVKLIISIVLAGGIGAMCALQLFGCEVEPGNPPPPDVIDTWTANTDVVDDTVVQDGNDVAEETTSDPCADYEWIVGKRFRCCGDHPQCDFDDTCVVYEKENECYFRCDDITGGYEGLVTDPIHKFDPPKIIKNPNADYSYTCTIYE